MNANPSNLIVIKQPDDVLKLVLNIAKLITPFVSS